MVFMDLLGNIIEDLNNNDNAQIPDNIAGVNDDATGHQNTTNSNAADMEDTEDIFHDTQEGYDEPPGIMMDYPGDIPEIGEIPGVPNQTKKPEPAQMHVPTLENEST
jgi:hypothetical protein